MTSTDNTASSAVHRQSPDRITLITFGLLSAVAILAIFGQSLTYDFTNWDDTTHIVNNPFLSSFSLDSIKNIVIRQRGDDWSLVESARRQAGLYIPVTNFSYLIEISLFGMNPHVFHATNVTIHVLNSILVMLLLTRLFVHPVCILGGCLVFACHPLQVETVSWCMGRKDLLSTFFALISLLCWDRYLVKKSFPILVAVLLGALTAMLAKPTTVVLPLVLLLVTLYRGSSLNRSTLAPIIFMVAMTLPIFYLNHGFSHVPETAPSTINRLLHGPWLMVGWMSRILLIGQTLPIYEWPSDRSLTYIVTTGVCALAIYSAVVIYAYRAGRRLVLFGLLFTMVTALPNLNVLLTYRDFVTADRYGYLPMIGMGIVPGALFTCLSNRYHRIVGGILGVWLLVAGATAAIDVKKWKNSKTLWLTTIDRIPESAVGYRYLGMYYESIEEWQDAIVAYRLSLTRDDNDAEVHFNLGNLYARYGSFDLSESHYLRALRLVPGYVEAMINLGRLYYNNGRMHDAIGRYTDALDFSHPYKLEVLMNLTRAYAAGNELEYARTSAQRANSYRETDETRALLKDILIRIDNSTQQSVAE